MNPYQPDQPPTNYNYQQSPYQGPPSQPGIPYQSQQPPMQNYQSQQPPFVQPPMQPAPKKKSGKVGWIIALIVVFFVGYGIGHSGSSSSTTSTTDAANTTPQSTQPQATPKPTKALSWQTTHTYPGSGSKKTETFAVSDDWKLQWKCDPASFDNIQYNIIVAVKNSDGTDADPVAINDLCKSGNTSGETEERHSGNVYLDITSEGSWTMTIQELK